LTGAFFVATITLGLSGSEAGGGATNSRLRGAGAGVAADPAVRDGTITFHFALKQHRSERCGPARCALAHVISTFRPLPLRDFVQ